MSKRFHWALGVAGFIAILAMSTVCVADENESGVLTIGSKAPALDVEHWVSDGNGKFKPVTEFESGKVYVVEFWATWCGPCIASMPHLAELQKTYADKGVQIVSISDEDLETVEGFLKRKVRGAVVEEDAEEEDGDEKKPAKNTYGALTSVYCLTTDPDGSSNREYMEAANQNGIPTSFIVGKDGVIEWIGHPMELDEPLSQIVDGTWDRKEYQMAFKIEEAVQSREFEAALEMIAVARKAAGDDAAKLARLQRFEFIAHANIALQMIQEGDAEEGLAKLDELAEKSTPEQKSQIVSTKFSILMGTEQYDLAATALTQMVNAEGADPEMLNQVSWTVYEAAEQDKSFSKPLIEAAIAAAEKAVKGAPENGMIIDTLAHFVYMQGKLDRAIELQSKAIEHADSAPEEVQSEMKAFLKKLQKEKAKTEKADKAEK